MSTFSQGVRTALAAVFLAGVLGGCAQTRASLDLARKTNAVVLSVDGQLESFRETQQRVAVLEAARLGDFAGETQFMEQELEEVGAGSEVTSLLTRAERLEQAEARPREAAAALEARVLAAQRPLAAPGERLKAVSANLVLLGEERDFEENVRFFIEFGKSVKDGIDKAREEREKALGKAAGSK